MFPKKEAKKVIITDYHPITHAQVILKKERDPLKLQPAIVKSAHHSHQHKKVIIAQGTPHHGVVVIKRGAAPQAILPGFNASMSALPAFIPPAPMPTPPVVAPDGTLITSKDLKSTKIVKRT